MGVSPNSNQEDVMDSSMIGKIEKAKRYAAEASRRVVFNQFRVKIEGDNNTWDVSFERGHWRSTHFAYRLELMLA